MSGRIKYKKKILDEKLEVYECIVWCNICVGTEKLLDLDGTRTRISYFPGRYSKLLSYEASTILIPNFPI